ncbi:MAG: hypothetical protein M4D80_03200 [Myxococcota bacterium]|nr:hypothetical protein [Myxococcota bacterium]
MGSRRLSFDPQDDAANLDATICDDNLPGVLFCESFEGPRQLLGGTTVAPSFVVEEGGPPVYRGDRALHAHTTRPQESAWILGSVLPTLMSGELWARWCVYIPATPVQFNLASVHIVDQQSPNHATVVGLQ